MKKKNILLLTLYGIIFFIILLLIFGEKQIDFYLLGEKNVILNYGKEYTDEGFTSKYCSKYIKLFCLNINDKVSIQKNYINDNIYYIDYSLNYKGYSKTISRKIEKKDLETPSISLVKNTDYICPNKEYIEEGFNAYDNIDGDITDKVKITNKDNIIYYSVSDSSGNKKIVYRELKYKDNISPTISLIGGDTVYTLLNREYVDRGYSIYDNCDGDITSNVIIESNLDTSKIGTYNIKYSIKDSNGNSSSINRKVVVYNDFSTVPKNGKVIYLTFDDGPNNYTTEILKILNEYNIKATFFVTNQFSEYQYLIKEEYDNGHSIGVHTYTHKFGLIYSSLDEYLKDFNNMNKIIYEQTGHYSKIFRFPGGSSNTVSRFNKGIITKISEKMLNDGYYYFDWNVDSKDTSTTKPKDIYNNVINEIKKKDVSVVLLHDIKKVNIESLSKIIEYGLNNGYTFLPLDENSPAIRHSINN